MTIIGISAFYHDSAAALIIDGNIIAAAQEERFTRKKHDAAFPLHALRYCLDHAAITLNDVDAVVFYDKPLLKFERLLETYYAFAPKGFVSFNKAIPVWLREKLFHKREIRQGLKDSRTRRPQGNASVVSGSSFEPCCFCLLSFAF
jgi:carbamoyltransferase